MNKEVIKAMNKKETAIGHFSKWWSKNGYKVMRVVLFPIWIGSIVVEKIQNKLNARQVWSEDRVNEILSYYIPRTSDWVDEDKVFYFFDNGFGWNPSLAKRYLKRKDRRFWKCHKGWCGGNIRKYLIDKFELEGFEKEVGECSDGRTEITFHLIEK